MDPKLDIDKVLQQFSQSSITTNGVSIEGKSLKLDTENDAKELVELMAKCKDLHFLNLAGNTLGIDAAKAVGKALETHPEFKRALWKDLFTGRLKTEIPQALQFLGAGLVLAGARLTELDMSDNAFGPIGVEGLAVLLRSPACYALQELRLNNNGLGIGGGKLLAQALLDCHKESSKAGQPLALRVFIAGRNRLENDGAKALAKVFETLGSLQEVQMPQNGIYHVGVSALSAALIYCPHLQVLNLNDNTLTWRGAKALAQALPNLPRLKTINLGDCLLKSQGAITLANALAEDHQELEEVILSFNEIGARGVEALTIAVQNKPKLKQLVLNGNQFGEDGRALLENKLQDLGLQDKLGSLSEDEDEGESDGDKSGDETEEESGSEAGSKPGTPASSKFTTPATTPASIKFTTPNVTPVAIAAKPSPVILNVPESPDRVGPVTLEEFLKDPMSYKLLAMGENRFETILAHFESLSDEVKIRDGMTLLMSVSSAAATRKEEHRLMAREIGVALYAKLIEWANNNNALSTLNNALLVDLKLIKCEESNRFKDVPWSLDGCMAVLEFVCQQQMLPFSTKNCLQIFLGRPKIPADCFPDSKRKLMTALFKY